MEAKLTHEELVELKEQFTAIDKNNDGYIDLKELRDALDVCGFKIPGWKVRQMEEGFKQKKGSMADGKLSYEEFEKLCNDLKAGEVASTFKQVVQKRENLQHLGGTSEASNEGTTHSVRVEEQLAFSDWINSNLKHDPDLKHLLPIDPDGKTKSAFGMGVPITLFLNAKGEITYRHIGAFTSAKQLDAEIKKYL